MMMMMMMKKGETGSVVLPLSVDSTDPVVTTSGYHGATDRLKPLVPLAAWSRMGRIDTGNPGPW